MGMKRRNKRTIFDYPEERIAHLKHEEKLTVEQVDEIRRRYRHHSRDANLRVLAEEFGVSITTIFNIVGERKWRFDDWQFRAGAHSLRCPQSLPVHKSVAFRGNKINELWI